MPSSPSELQWLTADAIVAINACEVAATGEPFIVLDQGKLDGALARPLSSFLCEGKDDILTLAVSLLMAIAKAHAFAGQQAHGLLCHGYVSAGERLRPRPAGPGSLR